MGLVAQGSALEQTMTRKDVKAAYKVVDGIIRSPGKFEGCSVYVPYYWNAGLEGMADEDTETDDGEAVFVFYPDEDDIKEFPELRGIELVRLTEDDNGFVYEV